MDSSTSSDQWIIFTNATNLVPFKIDFSNINMSTFCISAWPSGRIYSQILRASKGKRFSGSSKFNDLTLRKMSLIIFEGCEDQKL